MKPCNNVSECAFFNNLNDKMPISVQKLRERFCDKGNPNCALRMIEDKMHNGYEPSNENTMQIIKDELKAMRPNDTTKARLIMATLQPA